MIESDAPNPYLVDPEMADTLNTGIHALVASGALTVVHDPGLTTAFVTSALGTLVSFPEVGDASAATEWFRATCRQDDEPAANVLKAIHKELPLPMIPQAMLYVATVAVCSLASSVAHQYFGDTEEGDATPE